MIVSPSLRSNENFHIVLWLIKDLCWLMLWRPLGLAMIVPTVAMAVWIAWRCRNDLGELLHSLAVVFWICANSVWMITEFWFTDEDRRLAFPFFVLGLLCVAWYYFIEVPRNRRKGVPVPPSADPSH
jgi:hypothetical protein